MGESHYRTPNAGRGYQVPPTQASGHYRAQEPSDGELAYLKLRRLANKHGCHGDHCAWPDPDCAGCVGLDEAAHNADVAYLRQWMQALGMEPYESVHRPTPGSHGPAVVNYERPGR